MKVYITKKETPELKEYAPVRLYKKGYLCNNPKFLKFPENGDITYCRETVEDQSGWFGKLEEAYIPPHIMKDILSHYDKQESD